jgi:hypothetical protein
LPEAAEQIAFPEIGLTNGVKFTLYFPSFTMKLPWILAKFAVSILQMRCGQAPRGGG